MWLKNKFNTKLQIPYFMILTYIFVQKQQSQTKQNNERNKPRIKDLKNNNKKAKNLQTHL